MSIVNYTGLIYGISIGWFVFGETHPIETFIGMALVVVGVLASVIYTNRRGVVEAMDATAG